MKLFILLLLLGLSPYILLAGFYFVTTIAHHVLAQREWYRRMLGGQWVLERAPNELKIQGMNDFWRRPLPNEDYYEDKKYGKLIAMEDYEDLGY